MDDKLLIEILLKYDKDGKMLNELIEKQLIKKDDVVNFVIELNNFDIIYNVAKNIKGVDINKLGDKVLELSDAYDICKFAINIKGVNISKFENKIIEINNPKYICLFTKEMESKGANISRLENEIIKIGNASTICSFASDVKGANLKKLEDKIIELGDGLYISQFAFYVKEADIDRLADAVIKTKNNYWITYFAISKNAPVKKLLDVVINSGDYDGINFAIRMFGDKYTQKFVDVISKMENPYTIYEFAEKYNSKLDKTSIDKLADGIIKTAVDGDDMYVLELFIENINNAPVKKIKKVIINYNRGYYYDGYSEKNNLKVKKKLFNRKK